MSRVPPIQPVRVTNHDDVSFLARHTWTIVWTGLAFFTLIVVSFLVLLVILYHSDPIPNAFRGNWHLLEHAGVDDWRFEPGSGELIVIEGRSIIGPGITTVDEGYQFESGKYQTATDDWLGYSRSHSVQMQLGDRSILMEIRDASGDIIWRAFYAHEKVMKNLTKQELSRRNLWSLVACQGRWPDFVSDE